MSTLIDGTSVRQVALGIRVQKATASLPQTTDGALFTISGGRSRSCH